MMERKFTDDEIVKALDMCNYNADCDNCPCVGECWNVNKYAIDLINRQKAENSNLTFDLTSLQNDLTYVKAEIERLEGALKAEEQHNELTMEMAQKALQNAKTEAIKEFADRLKAKAMLQHGGVTVVYGSDIDNLVKEMTGEDSNE